MAKSRDPIINDFKVTGGYIYTQPTKEWAESLQEDIDKNDNSWRYKSQRLQYRRWREVMRKTSRR